jgi:endoribonuclease Dicer
VCPHLTSSSPFPSEDYNSYEHYYSQKYELDIINKDQPLLEVKAISNKLNYLRPKYVSYPRLYKLAQLKF